MSTTNPPLMQEVRSKLVGWLLALPNDAVVAAQAAGWLETELAALQLEMAAYRTIQVIELRESGWSLAEIGAELGMSRARVGQISERGT